MKHSRGNMTATILPILILASVAAAGWYYYYSEVTENEFLAMASRSEQEKLSNKLGELRATINGLLEEKTALQARVESEGS